MILLKKSPHLFLKIASAVMRLLSFNVTNYRAHIGGTYRKSRIASLPSESTDTFHFEPFRRRDLRFLDQLRKTCRRVQPHREMHMICDAARSETFALLVANDGRKIGEQLCTNGIGEQRTAIFRAEDDMNECEAESLRHAADYKSGLQPLFHSSALSWGVAPGWFKSAPPALALALFAVCCLGCKNSQLPAKSSSSAAAETYHFAPRPTVAPPAFKVFHQDDDTYTLVTRANATDDEVEAILWQFRDAARAHSFDSLHLSQKFVDTRKPSIWFHVYRGPKCAGEKFAKGEYPCGAKYNGAGDFTLGAYNNPGWNQGVLHHPDGSESQLWDSEAPDTGNTSH